MSEMLYRYEMMRYSLGVDEWDNPIPGCRVDVSLHDYPIVKRTPKGAWIDIYGRRRFVLLSARKQFACETPEQAARSFVARKQRQLRILQEQTKEVERALAILRQIAPGAVESCLPEVTAAL